MKMKKPFCWERISGKPVGLLLVLIVALFVFESAIMMFFYLGHLKVSPVAEIFLDSILLVVCLYPVLYFFVFREFMNKIVQLEQKEKIIREKEERYQALTETSPDYIKLFDLQGKIVFMNRSGIDEYKLLDVEAARKWDYCSGIFAADRDKFKAAFAEAVRGNMPTIELRHLVGETGLKTSLETFAPVKDAAGNVQNVFAVARDISAMKQLEEMRDFFVHMIAHDLKNPLGALMLSIEILKEEVQGKIDDAQLDKLHIAMLKCGELNHMIANMLEIHKLEQGHMKLRQENVDLGQLMIDAVESLSVLAQREKKKISVRGETGLPKIEADGEILRRTLCNLVANALKYSQPETEVVLAGALDEYHNAIIVSVQDSGQGIPPEYLDKVFDKFVQVETDPRTKKGGQGMGLAFCRLAVEAHGGKIWVESNPGTGCTFYFSLPIKFGGDNYSI